MPRSFLLPGQPTRYARDVPFKIEHLKLEIEPSFESKSIVGKATYKIAPHGRPISFVELDAAELNFQSITVNGAKAKFETLPRSARIEFGFDLMPDSTLELVIEYSAEPKKGLYFRGPTKSFPNRFVHLFTQGQAEDSKYWYPCFDYPNMQFKSEVLVKASAQMTAISNGRLLSTTDTGKEKRLWHFLQDTPHSSYLLSLIVGEYEKVSESHGGILLEYYVPKGRRDDVVRSFGKTRDMIDFFGSATGLKYPYPKYAQSVVSDFMFGGMENISATTLTEKTLHDERAHLDFQSENLVSHELAHQWFGDYFTCKDWSHAWLNEGFATYFNALFREHVEGEEDFQYTMHTNFERLDDDVKERYQRQVVETRYWDAEELFDAHTYEKGAWVLNGIRGVLGDEQFWKAIKRYVSSSENSIVETDDFRRAIEETSGLDFEQFFEQWLYSPGYPEYVAEYSYDESAKTAKLDLEQTNAGVDGVPLFANPLDIEFLLEDGTKLGEKITLTQKKNSFYFSFSRRPLNVSLDPKNWFLKKLKFRKPKEMLLHQLKRDSNSMERIRAAMELAEFKTSDVVQALSASIESDRFWGVRLEAAKNLGKIGTKNALDALLAKKNHKDHRTRRGVASGLRFFSKLEEHERAIDALIHYLDSDESYFVRAHSAHSLGFYSKSERAFLALRSALNQESVNDQIRYRAFLGFAEMKNPNALTLAQEYLSTGKEYQGRTGAAYAIGKIGKGNAEALSSLLSAMSIDDIRVRAEAATCVA
ncbi:MAG: HEAT repeat domain-containing protein, partial [Nitrososphaerota archaeon]|nr:HEAT repeat domain-containing protein [Nitrososphaerota archaeon]